MRVVAGEFKGRRLVAPKGSSTRPTADRVREALFSILGPVDGLVVLDVFAGSGALGIEALSRGAASATFVDSDKRAIAAIRANLGAIGVEAPVHRRDALAFLEAGLLHETAQTDLVFCDPPYSLAGRLAGRLSALLPDVISKSARIVTESDKRNPLRLDLPLELERTYGDTRIAIYRAV
jgi:16S rRNA (guanine966-N2)-methyltransferase